MEQSAIIDQSKQLCFIDATITQSVKYTEFNFCFSEFFNRYNYYILSYPFVFLSRRLSTYHNRVDKNYNNELTTKKQLLNKKKRFVEQLAIIDIKTTLFYQRDVYAERKIHGISSNFCFSEFFNRYNYHIILFISFFFRLYRAIVIS